MDKLVVDSESNQRECVRCGFTDQRPTPAQTELRTRVNRPARRVEAEVEAVTLVIPSSKDDQPDS
jgi:Zn ribbon nucleic-acid-binding protein